MPGHSSRDPFEQMVSTRSRHLDLPEELVVVKRPHKPPGGDSHGSTPHEPARPAQPHPIEPPKPIHNWSQFQRATLPYPAPPAPMEIRNLPDPRELPDDLMQLDREARDIAEETRQAYEDKHPFWAFDALVNTPQKIRERGGDVFSEHDIARDQQDWFSYFPAGGLSVTMLQALDIRGLLQWMHDPETAGTPDYSYPAAMVAMGLFYAVMKRAGLKKVNIDKALKKEIADPAERRRIREVIEQLRDTYYDAVGQLRQTGGKISKSKLGTDADRLTKDMTGKFLELGDGTKIRLKYEVPSGGISGAKDYGPNFDIEAQLSKNGKILARIELKLEEIPANSTQAYMMRVNAVQMPGVPHVYLTTKGVYLVPSEVGKPLVRLTF